MAAGFALRVALVFTTIGTNDAIFWTQFATLVRQVGVAGAYRSATLFLNHPPLILWLLEPLANLTLATGSSFPFVFRLLQVLADAVTCVALFFIGTTVSVERGRQLALFVALSPAAAFVSGFHCNSDPLLVALIMVAASLLVVPPSRPSVSAVALALATGIKIVPLLLLPVFVLSIRKELRLRFLAVFSAAAAIIFLPAILASGPTVIRHIFSYAGGLPYEWGVPGVAFAISRLVPGLRHAGESVMHGYLAIGRYVVYAAWAAVVLLMARRSVRSPALPLLHGCAIMILAVLTTAPGWGVQYVVWLIALLPFAFRWRTAVALNAAISLYLFITYTIWSGGLPWVFADLTRPGRYRSIAALAGYALWLTFCAALIVALRRFVSREEPETLITPLPEPSISG